MALIIGFAAGFVASALTTAACCNTETIPLILNAVDTAYRLARRLLAGAVGQMVTS
jgi:hypothetical protein